LAVSPQHQRRGRRDDEITNRIWRHGSDYVIDRGVVRAAAGASTSAAHPRAFAATSGFRAAATPTPAATQNVPALRSWNALGGRPPQSLGPLGSRSLRAQMTAQWAETPGQKARLPPK